MTKGNVPETTNSAKLIIFLVGMPGRGMILVSNLGATLTKPKVKRSSVIFSADMYVQQ